jgi:hypothetical protein
MNERVYMDKRKRLLPIFLVCVILSGCAVTRYLKGGIHRELDPSLSAAGLVKDPEKYVNRVIVFSVRYFGIGKAECPLGKDYVNIEIADRVSYITFKKVWMKKSKSDVLKSFKENETVVMKVRVFAVDDDNDPNLEALDITPE